VNFLFLFLAQPFGLVVDRFGTKNQQAGCSLPIVESPLAESSFVFE
jgi:hypothetical protein